MDMQGIDIKTLFLTGTANACRRMTQQTQGMLFVMYEQVTYTVDKADDLIKLMINCLHTTFYVLLTVRLDIIM
jgi:hypothetical protein